MSVESNTEKSHAIVLRFVHAQSAAQAELGQNDAERGVTIIEVDPSDFDEKGNLKTGLGKFEALRKAEPGVKIEIQGGGQGNTGYLYASDTPETRFSTQQVAEIIRLLPADAANSCEIAVRLPEATRGSDIPFVSSLFRALNADRGVYSPENAPLFRVQGSIPAEGTTFDVSDMPQFDTYKPERGRTATTTPVAEETYGADMSPGTFIKSVILTISALLEQMQKRGTTDLTEEDREEVAKRSPFNESTLSFLQLLLALVTSSDIQHLAQEEKTERTENLANIDSAETPPPPLTLPPAFQSLLSVLDGIGTRMEEQASQDRSAAQPPSPQPRPPQSWAQSGVRAADVLDITKAVGAAASALFTRGTPHK